MENLLLRLYPTAFVMGFIDDMTSDKKHYTTVLLKKVANDYGIKLNWDEE